MTDPDDRCSRSRSRSITPPVTAQAVPQPNFLADNVSADALGLHSMAQLNLQLPMCGVSAVPADSISLNDPEDPFGFHDGPRHNLAPQRLAEEYDTSRSSAACQLGCTIAKSYTCCSTNANPPRRSQRMALHRPMHDISGVFRVSRQLEQPGFL